MNQIQLSKLAAFKSMEEMAIEAAAKIMSGADELAISVHRILEEKLYLAELDEKGLPMYPTQEEYMPVLLRRLGISRSTLFNHLRPAKLAFGPTFNLTPAEFIETGGKRVWGNVADMVDYNTRTGEVIGVRKELPPETDVGSYIIEHVKDVAPSVELAELNLTPYATRQQLANALLPPEPEIQFWIEERTTMFSIQYPMEDDFLPDEIVGEIHGPEMTIDVLKEYKRRLKIYD